VNVTEFEDDEDEDVTAATAGLGLFADELFVDINGCE
jgi:hypothetical protein